MFPVCCLTNHVYKVHRIISAVGFFVYNLILPLLTVVGMRVKEKTLKEELFNAVTGVRDAVYQERNRARKLWRAS